VTVHRSVRPIAIVAVIAAGAAAAVPSVAALGVAPRCYDPPVVAAISQPFREPSCPYCAGRRGVTFASRVGDPVRAVAAGVVTFSGLVAGTAYLVVAHDDGLLATYGRIGRTWLRAGQRVRAGQVVATAGAADLYFGLRESGVYIDPEPRLGVRRFPLRLVPSDGGRRRSPGPGHLVCPLAR
jgi:murein DD-endopeptidase MepM/ murein hydrolase activator NlpD